ncbi:hypothetical protein R3W88_018218 [Solanum pinnatisectum]|uniref:RNase H type-1 domain-containing protein n=1 Tax=Solanum pinnatisectum TaxID=50273 RepID=A0AAV9L4Q2_9SOLN|nr:hypothetical protein R3W88_018218 [Solanum pinnatisectum]
MRNKYCKTTNQNLVMWKVGGGGSQVWKKMLQARELIEHQIVWQTRNGSASLWHDNWTGLGDLYTITRDDFKWDETYVKVADLATQGEWNVDILNDILPSDLVERILCHIKPPKERCPSRYWCCDKPDQETRSHVFLKSDFANRIWSYFCSFAGLNITGLQLREVIMLWSGANIKPDQKSFYRAMPSFIIWELWKRRNNKKHEGKNISLPRVIHNVTRNMFMLTKVRRPSMQSRGSWTEILKAMEDYRPRVKGGLNIYNTDGASKENPGVSSYAFCLRNERGDIMYVEGACMENTTNTVAEAKAILEASKHCKKSHYNQAIIQPDSMLMCKVLEGKWATPWINTDLVEEIKTILKDIQHTFHHIMREGNQLADYLANKVIEKGTCRYEDFNSLEPDGRRILNSDKSQTPYIRISPLRR